MVHHNKLVAAIKVAGKVLRETQNNTVLLPFGAEYTVLIKNLDSRKIKFKLSIDGKDATDGTWLVVQPNSGFELERYIRAGNLTSGNRFKFIERTEAIEGHRGVQEEDGLLRIEWLTERAVKEVPRLKYFDVPVPVERPYWPPSDPWDRPWPRPRPYLGEMHRATRSLAPNETERSVKASFSGGDQPSSRLMKVCDDGITVPGSQSNQTFYQVPSFETESSSEVMVIRLRGQIDGAPVEQAVTVKHKPKCQTCGRINDATASFCSQCGTALTLF